MPLRNSGMCALHKDKSHIGNVLIHSSLNSFNFYACIVGGWMEEKQAKEKQPEDFYVIKLWVFNQMFEIINNDNNINLYI